MPVKKSAASDEIFQVKVTLRWTRPPIWRRLLVPADMTLAQFHDVLQIAMGWQDSHLHDFTAGRRSIGRRDPEYDDMGAPKEDERRVRLSDVLAKVGSKVRYTYDFGDSWEHDIVLEKRLPRDPEAAYPICTAGKLACPPEDCGGVGGYYNLLEALNDPNHDDHEEMTEWIGGEFDPEAFSVESVNEMLAPAPRRGRKAAKS